MERIRARMRRVQTMVIPQMQRRMLLEDSENADGQNGGAPDGNGQGGEAPSMLDLTGEEQTITITADTVITKQAGGMQPGGDGQNGSAREAGR